MPRKKTPVFVPKYCILKGCNSLGHVDGVRSSHITLSGCPKYHNNTIEYFREIREPSQDLQPFENLDEELSIDKQFIKVNEPCLDGLASDADILLFRRAQQKLASDKKKEVEDHLITLAKLHGMQKDKKPLSSQVFISPLPNTTTETPLYTENNIKEIVFGDWEMQTWYGSVFPPTIACLPRIYICEFCLSYVPHLVGYRRHRLRCKRRFPPGNEIYRKDKLSFFEVNGALQKEYCHNLCLLAKLYLKQKTVHEIDRVSAFIFYILTKADESGCHIVGYFSKHKAEEQDLPPATFNNLSCVLVMPHYQRQGFGHMLIEFSYTLSRLEGRLGTPERPLSEPGLLVYRRYWRWVLLSFLQPYHHKNVSFEVISAATGMTTKDIITTLLDLGMLKYMRTKYFIVNDKAKIERILKEVGEPRPDRRIDTSCLYWLTELAPVVSRSESPKNKYYRHYFTPFFLDLHD
ncbi:Histone acetyltransferase MYST2 [Echinococcus granulosus]|uniref:Histone acetyltransferase n=1 Tax=Echinococcus granulosus TaxID=6210 RepID=W6UMV0_ECHGR|nr:Histone acetyltransferase MYST2 [Echinococcus granulosus]EUB62393.1 Histone acetyltransferase MYST2 [Echinococcus granulosus]